MITRVGIVGVGELGEAIATGLSIIPNPPQIHLSPRSRTASHRLATRFTNASVELSNQEVVNRSETILLTVPPSEVNAVLAELRVPADRLIISAVAGLRRDDLRALLPAVTDVVRVIPLPAVRRLQGVTSIFPASEPSERLFAGLGQVTVADTEEQFSALSAATATISTYLAYLDEITNWLAEHGWERRAAESFIRSVFAGIGDAVATPGPDLVGLVDTHETTGGINEQLRELWFDDRNQAALRTSLDHILARVGGRT